MNAPAGVTLMRDPRVEPEVLHIVDPHGRVRAVPIAAGISHALVDRAGVLHPEARAVGYVPLQELYERDGPAEGWAVWLAFVAAAKLGEAEEPIDWLPAEVRRRRELPAVTKWTPPPAPSSAKAPPADARRRGAA